MTLLVLGVVVASAANVQWTNTLGGSWHTAANWSPNQVPGASDKAFITANGTYSVTITNSSPVTAFDLGGGSGTQTLVIDNVAVLNVTNTATVFSGGNLVASNCWLAGSVNIQTGGQMQLLGPGGKVFYSLNLNNQGTIVWAGGTISVGATPVSNFTNSGLWQITGNDSVSNGGGTGTNTPVWFNSGTIRKVTGTGQTFLTGMEFMNQPSGVIDVQSGTLMLGGLNTNVVRGSFVTTAPGVLNIYNGTWTDGGGTASGTGLSQFTGATFNLRTNPVPGLKLTGGNIAITGGAAFQKGGAITNLTIDGAALVGNNTVDGGTLTFNTGSIPGLLNVLPAGQFTMATTGSKLLYGATVLNQGTVLHTDGSVGIGTTVVSNGGLWLVQSANNAAMAYGGGSPALWTNSGTLRKTTGAATVAQIDCTFVNLPGALVESLTGTLRFTSGTNSQAGGTFNATSPGIIEFYSGVWTDAGGIATGTGTNRLAGGTLNLRTNTIPGLGLVGGEIYITGSSTFQQAGAITNLTLNGTVLRGTNRVNNGTLTVNAGDVVDRLIIQPAGQLVLAGAGKNLYQTTIINQGTVNWTGGSLNVGGTPGTVISNGGLWQINGDLGMSYGGGQTPVWTNTGTLRKLSGSGTAALTGPTFYNQAGGLVQVDTGTLQLSPLSPNTAGTLRLNGGTLNANGTLTVGGSTLDGVGNVGVNSISAGIVSPGLSAAGLMTFPSGLTFGSGATLSIDGTGTTPGTSYDQLAVVGSVSLGNSTLSITGLPAVPAGTTFTIIANDGSDAISGTFNGLPENAILTVGSQPFRIHYAGGTGNDVTLVREASPPLLTGAGGLLNGNWQLSGVGSPSGIYTIQATTNFLTWTNIGLATGDISGHLTFSDTNAFRFQYRFYRTSN